MSELIRTFPAQRAVLREIRAFIREQARETSFVDEAEGLALAVTEACSNAIVHTNCTKIGVTWRATPGSCRGGGGGRRHLPPACADA